MPIRLTAQHQDVTGATRTIFIYDRDLLEYQDNIVICTSDFYKLKHEGDTNDPFKPIIPCNCQFTIFLRHPNYTEDEQTEVNNFFNDLVTSHEGRFYVKCQYGSELVEIETEFLGKIISDIGELTLDNWQTVEITAIDGLSGLKDVEYRPTGYSDLVTEFAIQARSFKDHFTDILQRNDVVDYFQEEISAFNTVMFTTSFFWTESKSVAGDIMKQVHVRNIYFEQVSPTYRKYLNCYEVLEDLLRGFVGRVIYSKGKYHFEQLPYQDNLTLVRYGYKYNGDPMAGVTYGNKETNNYTTDDNFRALPYPVKKWLPPFKYVEIESGGTFTNYINGLTMMATKIGYDGNDTFEFEYIICTGRKLISQWFFKYTDLPTIPVPNVNAYVIIRFKFKVKIGDYYLQTPDNVPMELVPNFDKYFVNINTQAIPELLWVASDRTVNFWIGHYLWGSPSEVQFQFQNINLFYSNTALVWETLEIQEDGEMTIEMVEFTVEDGTGTILGSAPFMKATMRNSSRVIIGDSYQDLYEVPKGIKRYEVGDVNNTVTYNTKLKYYDSGNLRFEQLFIKNTTYITTHELSIEWTDPDASITEPIVNLMMKTILAMRQKPAETIKAEFIFLEKDILRMDDRIAIDDELYIPLDMELYGGTGVYKMTLLKIFKDFDGINVIDTGEPEISLPYPFPDGGLDGSRVTNNTPAGVQYFEEWENISNNYVTVDNLETLVYGLSDEEIKTKIFFYINGVKQRYLDDTLVSQTFKFDTDNNRIYFFKGSGAVRHIEFFKYY
jgi:hypothetical protein